MGSSRIVRQLHESKHPYVVVSRAIVENEALTWEARGLLCYLLAKPDNWTIRYGDLITKGPGGRDRMQRIMKELRQYGYVSHRRMKADDGTFYWESLVCEDPAINPYFSKDDGDPDDDTIDGKAVDGKAVDGGTIGGFSVDGKAPYITSNQLLSNKFSDQIAPQFPSADAGRTGVGVAPTHPPLLQSEDKAYQAQLDITEPEYVPCAEDGTILPPPKVRKRRGDSTVKLGRLNVSAVVQAQGKKLQILFPRLDLADLEAVKTAINKRAQHLVFTALPQLQGYESPSPAKEMMCAQELVVAYDLEQIAACWQWIREKHRDLAFDLGYLKTQIPFFVQTHYKPKKSPQEEFEAYLAQNPKYHELNPNVQTYIRNSYGVR